MHVGPAVAIAMLAVGASVYVVLRRRPEGIREAVRGTDRDATLEAVAFAAGRFLEAPRWEECIDEVLARLGRAMDVSRVYLFRNEMEDGRPVMVQMNEWQSQGVRSQIGDPAWVRAAYDQVGPRWAEELSAGRVVTGLADEAPEPERSAMRRASPDVRSYLIVPVMSAGRWWGFLGFDECAHDRRWTRAEHDALAAAAAALGAAIDRSAAEDELRAAEERFRTLVEQMPAVTYLWDSSGDPEYAVYVSPQVEALFGYRPEEWVATPEAWFALVHPDDRESVREETRRTQETGERFDFEYRVERRDGENVWVRDEAVPVAHDGSGRPLLWQGVLHDITARKRTEDELRAAELRYRALVEQIPAITYAWELDAATGEPLAHYVSPQVESVLGYSPEEWHQHRRFWEQRLHPEDREWVVRAASEAQAERRPFELEYRFVAKDGRIVWVQDTGSHVPLEPDRLLVQGVTLDVTERKRAEAVREVLLARLVAAQEEERRRIAGDIHDDPVQKMTAVGLRLQMLRRLTQDREQLQVLDQLERSVALAIGRLRHLLFELRPPALDREGLVPALRQYVEETSGELTVDVVNGLIEEPPAEVRVIAYRIAQEAITNVRRHANAERLEVAIESRDRGVLVRIVDDGVGFDPSEVVERTGHFGLAAMRDRAELAGGWLRTASAVGRGTTVEYWIPWSAEGRGSGSAIASEVSSLAGLEPLAPGRAVESGRRAIS